MFKFVCGKCGDDSVECQTNGVVKDGKFTSSKCLMAARVKNKEVVSFYAVVFPFRGHGVKASPTICKAEFRQTQKFWIKVEENEEFDPPLTEESRVYGYSFFGKKYKRGYSPGASIASEALEKAIRSTKIEMDTYLQNFNARSEVYKALLDFQASREEPAKKEEMVDGPTE
jgi:hypothetical protein